MITTSFTMSTPALLTLGKRFSKTVSSISSMSLVVSFNMGVLSRMRSQASTNSLIHWYRYGAPTSHLSSHSYAAHTLTYDRGKKIPLWVAEVITRDMVDSNIANRKRSTFQPDPEVLAGHSAANEDYRGSGWSRGHMAPAGNYKFCQKSMDDTFYLTNILPQDLSNNSG